LQLSFSRHASRIIYPIDILAGFRFNDARELWDHPAN
jgi:hypothetical protein